MELTLEARRVQKELVKAYGDTPDIRRLAETAAQLWQRAEAAAATVDAEGLVITNKKGTFTHPAVTIERTSRLGYLSAVRAIRQQPKYTKIGRPSKSDAIARRFFGEDHPRPSPGFAKKYLRPPS